MYAAAAIGGLLTTVILIVSIMICRTYASKRPYVDEERKEEVSPSPSNTYSTSSDTINTENEHESRLEGLTSSSSEEDLDGSDSLPGCHSNYMKYAAHAVNTGTDSSNYVTRPTYEEVFPRTHNSMIFDTQSDNYTHYSDIKRIYFNKNPNTSEITRAPTFSGASGNDSLNEVLRHNTSTPHSEILYNQDKKQSSYEILSNDNSIGTHV